MTATFAKPKATVHPWRQRARLLAWGALAAAGLHCGDAERAQEPGAVLRFSWTIDESAAGARCAELGADQFQVTLFHQDDIVDRYAAPCDAFELTTQEIHPNDEYTARATLVDGEDNPRSRTVTSSMFSLAPNETREMVVNFDTNTLVPEE